MLDNNIKMYPKEFVENYIRNNGYNLNEKADRYINAMSQIEREKIVSLESVSEWLKNNCTIEGQCFIHLGAFHKAMGEETISLEKVVKWMRDNCTIDDQCIINFDVFCKSM